MNALMENRWQGNVRELNHVIERAVLLAQDTQIRLGDLALRTGPGVMPRLEEMSLEEVESHLIRKAPDRYQGNVSQAAHALGLPLPSPPALWPATLSLLSGADFSVC